jgi:mevalonate kinase
MEELHVSAPGKVILHGEHSVVYGKVTIISALLTYLIILKFRGKTEFLLQHCIMLYF